MSIKGKSNIFFDILQSHTVIKFVKMLHFWILLLSERGNPRCHQTLPTYTSFLKSIFDLC